MGEKTHNTSVESTGAVERQPGFVDRVSAEVADAARRVGNVRDITRYSLAVAVMAFASMLDSCGGQVGDESVGAAQAPQAPETVAFKDRQIYPSYDGEKFFVTGAFPKDFRLVVEANGKVVFDKSVNPVDGKFDLKGEAFEMIQALDLKASALDGVEIPIEQDEDTKGIYGLNHLDAPKR